MLKIFIFILFLFASSIYSQSFSRSGYYDPIRIPDSDPFDERNSEEERVGSFYSALNFGYFFAKVDDLSKIQSDFKDAGVNGLSPVGGFWGFRLETGYQNLADDLDVFATIGYHFSPGRSGSGDINYGLNTLDSTVSFGLYYVPLLAGARYAFFTNEWVRLGLQANLGISFIRGNITINPNQSSNTIEFSSLNYGGTAYTGELLVFSEWGFYKAFKIGFDMGYSLNSLSNVKIRGSSGNFSRTFSSGDRLMIYDSASGTSSPLKIKMSSFIFMLGIKTVF
jgi:hypothetical protein